MIASCMHRAPRGPPGAGGADPVLLGDPAPPASSTLYWASEAMVICWVSVTPAAAGSTRNRSTSPGASPVRASTTSREAADAKATWRLVPVMVHPSPSGTARTWTPVGPELFSGSSQAGVRMASPDTMPGSQACFWLVAARPGQAATRHDGADEVGRRGHGPAELLVDHDASRARHARAAVLLGQLQADQVEVGQLLPQLGRVAGGVVLELAHHARAGWWWRPRRAPSHGASPVRG